VITGIAARADLDEEITAHVLRHTFATTLVRGGTDLVIVAELLGHARLETTRGYTRPGAEDRRPSARPAPRRSVVDTVAACFPMSQGSGSWRSSVSPP